MQLKELVYQVCISRMEHNNDGERVYIGISAGNWKQRLYNHRHFPIHDLETEPLNLDIFEALRIRG